MLTWLKKRCRRNSAPSEPSKKSRSCFDADVTPPFYYELEDDSGSISDHSYAEVPEISPASYATYSLAKEVACFTQHLVSDLSHVDILCPVCRKGCSFNKTLEHSLCSCYAEPNSPIYSKAANIQPCLTLDRRCFAEYDMPSHCLNSSPIYSTIDAEKKRKLFRSRSDIRRRPLPEIPIRRGSDDDVTFESESSGFYENIDTDEEPFLTGPYMSDSILV